MLRKRRVVLGVQSLRVVSNVAILGIALALLSWPAWGVSLDAANTRHVDDSKKAPVLVAKADQSDQPSVVATKPLPVSQSGSTTKSADYLVEGSLTGLLTSGDSARLNGDQETAVGLYAAVIEGAPGSRQAGEAQTSVLAMAETASTAELDAMEAGFPTDIRSFETKMLYGAFLNLRANRSKSTDRERSLDYFMQVRDLCYQVMQEQPDDRRQWMVVDTYLAAQKQLGAESDGIASIRTLSSATETPTMATWAMQLRLSGTEPPVSYLKSASSLNGLSQYYFERGAGKRDAGMGGAAREDFSRAADAAWQAMWSEPNAPEQINIVPRYFDATSELGEQAYVTALKDALAQFRDTTDTFPLSTFMIARELAGLEARQRLGWGEVLLQGASLISHVERGALSPILESAAIPVEVKAAVEYEVGYIYFEQDNLGAALDQFERVLAVYPNAGKPTEEAALGIARVIEKRDWWQDPLASASFYENFFATYPDSSLVPEAILHFGRVLMNGGRMLDGVDWYYHILTYYPNHRVAREAQESLDFIQRHLMSAERMASARAERETFAAGEIDAYLCGPRALMALLAEEGIDTTVEELSDLARATERGASMADLVQAALAKGVSLEGVAAKSLTEVKAPFIAHIGNNHFVTVKRYTEDAVYLAETDGTESELSVEEFMHQWHRKALVQEDKTERAAMALAEPVLRKTVGGDLLQMAPANCDNSYKPEKRIPEDCCKGKILEYFGINGPGTQQILGSTADPSYMPPFPYYASVSSGTTDDVTGMPVTLDRPTQALNFGLKSPRIHASILGFQTGLQIDESDILVPSRGPMSLAFRRSYHHRYGYAREYYTDHTVWYKNNMGYGWTHNWNTHLIMDTTRNTIVCMEWEGNPAYFTRDATDPNLYNRGALHTGGSDIADGTTWDQGVVLKYEANQYGTGNVYNIYLPHGAIYTYAEPNFSVPTNDPAYGRSRLLWVNDVSGNNRYILNYDANNKYLLDVYPPNYGVNGDNRSLHFSYTDVTVGTGTAHMLSSVSLNANNDPIQSVNFYYDVASFLEGGIYTYFVHLARVRGVDGRDVRYYHDEATQTVCFGDAWRTVHYRYMSRLEETIGSDPQPTLLAAVDLDWDYRVNSDWWNAYKITASYDNGLTTVFERASSPGIMVVENYDGQQRLTKSSIRPGPRGWLPAHHDFFIDDTYAHRWAYNYFHATNDPKNGRDIRKVFRPWEPVRGDDLTYWGQVGDMPKGTALWLLYDWNAHGSQMYVHNKDYHILYNKYDTADDWYPSERWRGDPNGPRIYLDHSQEPTELGQAHLTKLRVQPDPLGDDPSTFEFVYGYDNYGQVTTITQTESGDQWVYAYNGRGDLTSKTDPTGSVTSYTHDSFGRLHTISEPGYPTLTYNYAYEGCGDCPGNRGDLTSIMEGQTVVRSYYYDDNGNLTSVVTPEDTWEYTYNVMNRLTSVSLDNDELYSMTYNKLGLVQTLTEDNVTYTFQYDHRCQVKKITDTLGGEVNFAYNWYGVIIGTTDALGAPTTYSEEPNLFLRHKTNAHLAQFGYRRYAAGPGEERHCNEEGDLIRYGLHVDVNPPDISGTVTIEDQPNGTPTTIDDAISLIYGPGNVVDLTAAEGQNDWTFAFWKLNDARVDGTEISVEVQQATFVQCLFATGDTTGVLINEFLINNATGLQDEDGARSSWVELLNTNTYAVRLEGVGLTDDPSQPHKWTFPNIVIGPGDYLIVYCSGKNRRPTDGSNLHTNFTLDTHDYLALFTPGATPAALSEWNPGTPVLDTDESLVRVWVAASESYRYYRSGASPATSNPPSAVSSSCFPPYGPGWIPSGPGLTSPGTTFRDPELEGCAPPYGADGGPGTSTGTGTTTPAAVVRINELCAVNEWGIKDEDGDRSEWVEIFNGTAAAVDLNNWRLTNGTTSWYFPSISIPADGYLVVFASGKNRRPTSGELHTNFALSGGGGYLALYDGTATKVSEVTYPATPYKDCAYALFDSWFETKVLKEPGRYWVLPATPAKRNKYYIGRAVSIRGDRWRVGFERVIQFSKATTTLPALNYSVDVLKEPPIEDVYTLFDANDYVIYAHSGHARQNHISVNLWEDVTHFGLRPHVADKRKSILFVYLNGCLTHTYPKPIEEWMGATNCMTFMGWNGKPAAEFAWEWDGNFWRAILYGNTVASAKWFADFVSESWVYSSTPGDKIPTMEISGNAALNPARPMVWTTGP